MRCPALAPTLASVRQLASSTSIEQPSGTLLRVAKRGFLLQGGLDDHPMFVWPFGTRCLARRVRSLRLPLVALHGRHGVY